jgi:hypothetical protein
MKNTVVIMIAIALLSIAAKIGSHDLWPESVETVADLDGLGFFNAKWTHFEHDKMRIAVAVEDWPTDGESYIDVYGYVFNVHFEQWRRFLAVKIRGAGLVERSTSARSTTTGPTRASDPLPSPAALRFFSPFRAVFRLFRAGGALNLTGRASSPSVSQIARECVPAFRAVLIPIPGAARAIPLARAVFFAEWPSQ